jgi:hypothetical protein
MLTYKKIPSNFKTPTNIGLGNQMFFMASTIGIATKLGYSYGFEPFYPEVFPNQAPVLIKDKPCLHVPWGYHDVKIKDNHVLSGYMQSEKYFKHCRDKVLWHFQMNKMIDYTLPEDAVCIHVRRGDYVNSKHHYNLGMDYYFEAMGLVDGTYYVFSDDIAYCRDMFKGTKVCFVNGKDVFTDFYLMLQCKKFIIANSSLSWWASWIVGGETIAPKNWFGPKLNLDTTDLYCEGWKVI